jgi:aldehyde:ferredoxin oxidoreductase
MSSGTTGHCIREAGLWSIDVAAMTDSPTYLEVNNRKVEFKDATLLWGMEPIGIMINLLTYKIGLPLPTRRAS